MDGEGLRPDVLADARWVAPHGIGRFAREVLDRLPWVGRLDRGPPVLHPSDPLWLTATLMRRRPTVYFSPGFNPPLRCSASLVFTIHDLVHLHFPQESSLAKRLYYRFVVRPGARRADRLLTVSDFSRKEIAEWAGIDPDRIVVVGNGVGPPFGPDGPHHDPGFPYLLFVGLRRPHKNVDRLIEAFAASGLAEELRLVFAGPSDPWDPAAGPSDTQTVDLARRRGLLDAVHFAGRLEDAELASYYRGARALVLPSSYEGFGLPALEAMACGTPVLAARAAALPEVAGDAAVLVDPFDVEELTAGLRRVVADEELRADLVARGGERARHWTWDRVADRIACVLDELGADSGAPR